jgi:hypothetical protein
MERKLSVAVSDAAGPQRERGNINVDALQLRMRIRHRFQTFEWMGAHL